MLRLEREDGDAGVVEDAQVADIAPEVADGPDLTVILFKSVGQVQGDDGPGAGPGEEDALRVDAEVSTLQ